VSLPLFKALSDFSLSEKNERTGFSFTSAMSGVFAHAGMAKDYMLDVSIGATMELEYVRDLAPGRIFSSVALWEKKKMDCYATLAKQFYGFSVVDSGNSLMVSVGSRGGYFLPETVRDMKWLANEMINLGLMNVVGVVPNAMGFSPETAVSFFGYDDLGDSFERRLEILADYRHDFDFDCGGYRFHYRLLKVNGMMVHFSLMCLGGVEPVLPVGEETFSVDVATGEITSKKLVLGTALAAFFEDEFDELVPGGVLLQADVDLRFSLCRDAVNYVSLLEKALWDMDSEQPDHIYIMDEVYSFSEHSYAFVLVAEGSDAYSGIPTYAVPVVDVYSVVDFVGAFSVGSGVTVGALVTPLATVGTGCYSLLLKSEKRFLLPKTCDGFIDRSVLNCLYSLGSENFNGCVFVSSQRLNGRCFLHLREVREPGDSSVCVDDVYGFFLLLYGFL
jgi:hypothetical protein